jgi:hypothetical protein
MFGCDLVEVKVVDSVFYGQIETMQLATDEHRFTQINTFGLRQVRSVLENLCSSVFICGKTRNGAQFVQQLRVIIWASPPNEN